MNYTLKHLRYFVTVAEHRSVTRAADALHVSQPAISSAVAQLEKIFDVQLLIRHQAKGVDLTSSGRAFLVKARQLLTHADELSLESSELGESLRGSLDVGCFVTLSPFYLPSILKQMNAQYADIGVTVHEGAMDTLQRHLLDGTCEVALLYGLDMDERIDCEVMAKILPYALLPKAHRLAKRKTVSLKELAMEPMILIDLPHSRDYFRSLFLQLGIEPRIQHRTRSFELIRGMVANGHGYSLLNLKPAVNTTYDGTQVACVQIKEKLEPLQVCLAWYAGIHFTRRARAFVEVCRQHFAESVVQ